MEKQNTRQEAQEKDDASWASRLESLANQLVRITPNVSVPEPGHNSTMTLYPAIFPDQKLRDAIEAHVVLVDPTRTRFSARSDGRTC